MSVTLISEEEILSSWGEYSTPLVSICCTTYNHSRFVQDALEGFLMQKTTFPFEIVIFDDASTDGTQKIIEEYMEKYPNLFVPFLQKENLWQGKGISGTFTIAFPNARGKYIALCEGDDYWIDPYKLQKQVYLLDKHPEYSICFHNVTEVYEDKTQEPQNSICCYPKQILDIEDLLYQNFAYTCTAMFRRSLFSKHKFPDWYLRPGLVEAADYPLWIFNAEHGKIAYLHEVMAVYRHHSGGFWSTKDKIHQLKNTIRTNQYINKYLNFNYQKIIKSKISYFYYEIALEYQIKGNIAQARKYFIKCLFEFPFNRRVSKKQLLKQIICCINNKNMFLIFKSGIKID
ncbi:glycosyltransferase [Tolypothrix sp. FACHB-123]|uniref:glycosyltransferase n=1 Tax=Tolypothrix sp. FACHB-123 TaxID=2692868 RepID=UPI001688F045|nr:glycosyltransferase [Tolypothrix sp. FACHB-123]MBD2358449.1 glycosyltransferase [Tolypothrix sp. FACHB-123]